MTRRRGDNPDSLRRHSVPTPRLARGRALIAGVAVAVAGVAAAVAVAGCGGHRSVAIERPVAPVWCPATAAPPGGVAPRRRLDARGLLGLGLDAARRAAAAFGCAVRAVAVDGRRPPLSGDLRDDRVDVYVVHAVVYRLVGVY